jgi:hypothetical protein
MSGVKCDEMGCSWSEECEKSEIKKWHNVPCPSCGKGCIITDEEMALLDYVLELEKLSQESGEPLTEIFIDTAILREEKKCQ